MIAIIVIITTINSDSHCFIPKPAFFMRQSIEHSTQCKSLRRTKGRNCTCLYISPNEI